MIMIHHKTPDITQMLTVERKLKQHHKSIDAVGWAAGRASGL